MKHRNGDKSYKGKWLFGARLIISCLSHVLLEAKPVFSLFFSFPFRVAVSYVARVLQLSLFF